MAAQDDLIQKLVDALNGNTSKSSASLDNLATNGKLLNQNISQLIMTISGILPRIAGTFTLAASVTTTVPQTSTTSTSYILLMPTNAAAGTLMGSAKSLYISARTQGASFAVSTASGAAAAGTETFLYLMVNLV